jgi:stage IV sporulation protein B
MLNRFRSKHFRWICAVVVTAVCLSPPVHQLAELPTSIQVPLGDQAIVHLRLPTGSAVASSDTRVVGVQPMEGKGTCAEDIAVQPRNVGHALVSTKLFGFLPWKTLQVHVVPQHKVYVGGQSIGIRLKSRGVMVVGFQRVGQERKSPAANADIRLGDVIEEVNNHAVSSADEVRRWVRVSRGPIRLEVRRQGERRHVELAPASDDQGSRRLGLYVREKTSGVGTLTYYDPQTHRFGALGHVIADADTGQPIVGTGTLFNAEVTGMVRGTSGKPGEKRGRFVSEQSIGHIEQNTPYGVFGTMDNLPEPQYLIRELPVALPGEVREGPAKMLTVVQGRQIEAFDVEIENLVKQRKPGTKSMIVHVVDKRLLALTGGIVQGMSGSPLIQNGRLIGAVTHVFVSDPTRGYGVYAAWMLEQGQSNSALQTDRSGATSAFAKRD